MTVKLEKCSFFGRPLNIPIPHSRHVSSRTRSILRSGCTEKAWKGRRHNRSGWSVANAAPRLLNFPSYQRNFFTFTIADFGICVVATTYLARLSAVPQRNLNYSIWKVITTNKNYYGSLSLSSWRFNRISHLLHQWNDHLTSFFRHDYTNSISECFSL